MDKGLAATIKTLRKRKGLSQEQLAEESTLSLRTIQRIENGKTTPHGDTLRKLTEALGVTTESILERAPRENSGYLAVMNLSVLSFLFHPLLGIVVPMGMWILKKDEIKLVDDSGRRILNFQITWILILYALQLFITKGKYIRFDLSFMEIVRVLSQKISIAGVSVAFLYLYNIVLVVVNVRRSQVGHKSSYKPSIAMVC